MEMLSSLVTRDSDVLKYFSNLPSSARRHRVSMTALSKPSWNAILISEETCMLTLSCPEARLCSLVSQKEWLKSSPHLHPQQWRSRLSHPQKENTLYGSVVQFLPLCQLSNRCGFLRLSMTSRVHLLYTENAFRDPWSYWSLQHPLPIFLTTPILPKIRKVNVIKQNIFITIYKITWLCFVLFYSIEIINNTPVCHIMVL